MHGVLTPPPPLYAISYRDAYYRREPNDWGEVWTTRLADARKFSTVADAVLYAEKWGLSMDGGSEAVVVPIRPAAMAEIEALAKADLAAGKGA